MPPSAFKQGQRGAEAELFPLSAWRIWVLGLRRTDKRWRGRVAGCYACRHGRPSNMRKGERSSNTENNMIVDAVITWVDGTDPAFREKYDRYAEAGRVAAAKSKIQADTYFSPVRYVDNQELRYCLRSIAKYAPWIRKIWLVTDSQVPCFLDPDVFEDAQIELISHQQIFAGRENALPTFAPAAIESMLWRIPGLARRFLFFNDDCFLLNHVVPEDFYNPGPVLRGKRVDLSEPPASWLWRRHNAVNLLGLSTSDMFQEGHVVSPLLKPVFRELFKRFRSEFLTNISLRFSSESAFSPVSLHNNYLLQDGAATEAGTTRNVVLDACDERRGEEHAMALLARFDNPRAKFGCINNLGSFFRTTPKARKYMEDRFGPPLPVERLDYACADDATPAQREIAAPSENVLS